MLFQNQTEGIVFLPIGRNGIRVQPKATVDIPDGYSHPRRADNGSRRPSVVEKLAGGEGVNCKLVPADPSERTEWLQAPAPKSSGARAAQMPTVEGYIAAGIPRAQAEILVRQALQAAMDALPGNEAKADYKSAKSK